MSLELGRYENCSSILQFRAFGDDYVIIEEDDEKGIRVSLVNTKDGPLRDVKIGV